MAHMAIEAICPKHHRFERFKLDIITKMNVKADTWEIIEKRPNYETTGVLIGKNLSQGIWRVISRNIKSRRISNYKQKIYALEIISA